MLHYCYFSSFSTTTRVCESSRIKTVTCLSSATPWWTESRSRASKTFGYRKWRTTCIGKSRSSSSPRRRTWETRWALTAICQLLRKRVIVWLRKLARTFTMNALYKTQGRWRKCLRTSWHAHWNTGKRRPTLCTDYSENEQSRDSRSLTVLENQLNCTFFPIQTSCIQTSSRLSY